MVTKNIRVMRVFLIALLVCGTPSQAHHSFAATYLEDRSITIEGKLVQFLFRNPHSFVHVEVKDANGEVSTWAVEWAAPSQLGVTGVNNDVLKPGDEIVVVGNPGRNPDAHRMRLQSITRKSDGWTWKGRFT